MWISIAANNQMQARVTSAAIFAGRLRQVESARAAVPSEPLLR
jgi:hypothetical protein